MSLEIVKFRKEYHDEVVQVWERSVRATHHFVDPADIAYYKGIVQGTDFSTFEVYCTFDENNHMVGILGVAERKIEMLFLVPEIMGKGVGKKMIDFAINELKAEKVDVNEANTKAVNFYKKAGFIVYDRTPMDDNGRPYPILKMELSR